MSDIILQGSPAWFAQRAGRATASEFETVQMEGRSKNTPSETRFKYAVKLAMERITGIIEQGGEYAATEHGKTFEPYAQMAYEEFSGNVVETVSFVRHPGMMAGASPDGLIDADGGLEIKCPANPLVHFLTIKRGMPKDHIGQVQGGMLVTGRKWWDFVSYRPDVPDGLKLYVQRIQRDDIYIATLEAKLKEFLNEVDGLEAFYRSLITETMEETLNMEKILISNAGTLEIFGPNGKPWRTADDAYLGEAVDLVKSDASAGLKLASELVAKAMVAGVVRFRCAVPARIV